MSNYPEGVNFSSFDASYTPQQEERILDIQEELADMQTQIDEVLADARFNLNRYRHVIKQADIDSAILSIEEAMEEALHDAIKSLRNRADELNYQLADLKPSPEKVQWLLSFHKRQTTNPQTLQAIEDANRAAAASVLEGGVQ